MENYFLLFEIGEAFVINKPLLKQKYFELSRKYHPDFFANSTNEEKEVLLQKSSSINKGYKCLSDDDETMKHLLLLNGIVNEDEKFALSNAFLMQMMDFNEALLEAKTSNKKEDLHKIITEIKAFENKLYAPIKSYVETYNENSYSQEGLLQVKEYYFKKKYINKIIDGTV